MKERRLKRWVKNLLWLVFGCLIGIAIYQLITEETTRTTVAGEYTCKGGILEVCTGSKQVADYIGA